MKKKKNFKFVLCILVALVLFIGGIFIGAYKGWKEEFQKLEIIAQEKGNLKEALGIYLADVNNLLVVAHRHLPKEEKTLTSLEGGKKLLSKSSSLKEDKEAFQQLPSQVTALSQKLKQSPTFANSQRDQIYLSTLEKDLSFLQYSAQTSTYNIAAADFNQRISHSFSGQIALRLGLSLVPIF